MRHLGHAAGESRGIGVTIPINLMRANLIGYLTTFKRWSKKTSQVFVTVDCDCELRVLTTKGRKVKSGCHKPSDNGTI